MIFTPTTALIVDPRVRPLRLTWNHELCYASLTLREREASGGNTQRGGGGKERGGG